MKGKDVFRGMQYLKAEYLEEAEFGTFSREAFYREETPRRKRHDWRRVLLVAAAIALTAALVGCGIVYMLKLQNLKLGDQQVTEERWDHERHTLVEQTVPQQILTSSGLKGSPNYQAAQEWYVFKQIYDPDHEKFYAAMDSGQTFPEEYAFYSPYTQEMVDKIEEICAKYDLKCIGAPVKAQSGDDILEYLNIESVLQPNAPANTFGVSMLYYESGYFRWDFNIRMDAGEGVWPFESLMSYLYSPKDCFNDDLFMLEGDDWQERNYTTKSGHEVLILRSPTVWESWVFCDRKDATITLRMETLHQVYTDENGYLEVIDTPMTDEQLDQILDTVNFDLKLKPGDPAVLEGRKPSEELAQTQNGYTVEVKNVITDGCRILVTLGITAPEGTDLEQYLAENAGHLRFASPIRLSSYALTSPNYGGGSFGAAADGDGKANTVDYIVDMSEHSEEGSPYPEGGKVNLLLQDLYAEVWNREQNQREILWEMDGVWNFDIPIEDGDWREVEFIREPVTVRIVTGWDLNGNDIHENVAITSLKLRALGGEITHTGKGYADICDYRNEKFPTLVLKDGRTIRLMETLQPCDDEWDGKLLPLDEIDYLELIDGTRLTPVN